MAMQIRVYADRAPRHALHEHLSESQRKKLEKKRKLVIACDGNRQEASKMRRELRAVYVS